MLTHTSSWVYVCLFDDFLCCLRILFFKFYLKNNFQKIKNKSRDHSHRSDFHPDIANCKTTKLQLIFQRRYMKIRPRNQIEKSDAFFEIANSWLSTNDVARLLSLSPNAVRIMVCRGLLPAYKLRNRLRFRKKDCLALVQKTGA